jgi:catechol 2,3-dioxygenase-like lactoylglutathione lyase family enzyme
MAAIRYFVTDVQSSVDFYTRHLGFVRHSQSGTAIAAVARADLIVWLSGPESSAGRPLSDGGQPIAGGWNRFILEVDDLEGRARALEKAGVQLRGDAVMGPGGTKILVEDPDGNLIELFEPATNPRNQRL